MSDIIVTPDIGLMCEPLLYSRQKKGTAYSLYIAFIKLHCFLCPQTLRTSGFQILKTSFILLRRGIDKNSHWEFSNMENINWKLFCVKKERKVIFPFFFIAII